MIFRENNIKAYDHYMIGITTQYICLKIDNEYLTGNSAIFPQFFPYSGEEISSLFSVLKKVIISPGDCRIYFP